MENWQKLSKNDKKLRNNLEIRMATIQAIRRFFDSRNYAEVETPTLSKTGEQNVNIDQFQAKNTENPKEQYYLTTSPEYSMKKLLAAGYENIYQLCKAYRAGEPPTRHHQPEFTILEWYTTNATWQQLAKETEQLVQTVSQDIASTHHLAKNVHHTIELISAPWKQYSMEQLFQQYTNIQLDKAIENKALLEEYLVKQYDTKKVDTMSWEDCFNLIFLNEIEPHLGKTEPNIVTHYPYHMAALAEKDVKNPNLALRFELYVQGTELANAFQELRDPEEQLARFKKEQQLRKQAKKHIHPIDTQLIEALQWGIPKCAGIAFGVDRFIMLMCRAKTIQETLWFPFE